MSRNFLNFNFNLFSLGHTIIHSNANYSVVFQFLQFPGTWVGSKKTKVITLLLEKGYVKERLKSSLRKFYGRYVDLIRQYEVSLSQVLNDILWPDHIQWQPPTDLTLYRTRHFTEFWVVSIEHLRRVWHADRGRLLLRTPDPVPLGLAYVLLVETNPFQNLSLFYRTMLFEYPSVLSRFCFAT